MFLFLLLLAAIACVTIVSLISKGLSFIETEASRTFQSPYSQRGSWLPRVPPPSADPAVNAAARAEVERLKAEMQVAEERGLEGRVPTSGSAPRPEPKAADPDRIVREAQAEMEKVRRLLASDELSPSEHAGRESGDSNIDVGPEDRKRQERARDREEAHASEAPVPAPGGAPGVAEIDPEHGSPSAPPSDSQPATPSTPATPAAATPPPPTPGGTPAPVVTPEAAFVHEEDPLVLLDGRAISNDDLSALSATPESIFDEVLIHEEAWAWLQRHSELRSRMSTLVRTVEHFYANDQRIHSVTIRRIDEKHYKIRLTKSLRIPFSFSELDDGSVRLTFWKVLTHDEGERIHETGVPEVSDDELVELPSDFSPRHLAIEYPEPAPERTASEPLYRVWHLKDEVRLAEDYDADLPWLLSPEQQAYTEQPGPLLLKGSAGSGKTTIAIYRLLMWEQTGDRRLYVTYTQQLRDHAERLYRQLADVEKKARRPDFTTIEALCRRLVPDADVRFDPERRFTSDLISRIPALQQMRLPLPLELLWEEIRGVIKGAFQVVESRADALPRAVYEDVQQIPSDQSLVPEADRPLVYTAFEKYQKWLRERDYWDDLDLAREAYRRLEASEEAQGAYDQLIVDEVQDLTTFHIQLLLLLSRTPQGLYLTGDAQQAIHPSRFEWARVKHQTWEHVQAHKDAHYYYGPDLGSVEEVKTNYRSPRAVVQLANAVTTWRNVHFKEGNATLEAVREGEPIYTLKPAPCSKWTSNRLFSHRLMVIVPGGEVKAAAQEEFGRGRVFTIHEAKGLEADYVLLWGFFDPETGAWDYDVLNARRPDASGVQERLRYQVSLFNVAVTRARDALFLIDHTLPLTWPPLREAKLGSGNAAQEQIRVVLNQRSSSEDYFALAKELEERGPEYLEQAAGNYFDGGFDREGNRCLGLWAERREAYREAGDYYKRAEMPAKAVACYDRAGDYERAFRLMLTSETGEGMLRVEEYLADEKRLAKLDGGVAEAIAVAIASGHGDAPLDTLYTYSMHRTRLARAGIRETSRNTGRSLKSKDFKLAVSRFDTALLNLETTTP